MMLHRFHSITPGTVLKVRSVKKGVYHFGIASYGNTVIDQAPRKGIARRSWNEFAEGQPVEIVSSGPNDFSKQETHRRAELLIGSQDYHLLHNNCEHFVNLCSKGKRFSQQLAKTGEYAVIGMVTFGILNWLFSDDKE